MERHSLAVLVDRFSISQMTVCMIHNLNELCKDHNVFLFYNELSDFTFKNKFSILPMREMYTYDGHIIATCEYTARQLLHSFCAKRKFFYIWNFEWNNVRDYDKTYKVYLDEQIELIARSRYHKKLIEYCWKKPLIIEDFNHEQLIHLFNKG